MEGFIVIDKPSGMTSHDVVNTVRRITGRKRVGHTGTLDPFATGVLPVALGEATKAIPYLDEGCKEYRAVMRLGEITDTQDCTGEVIDSREWPNVSPDALSEIFSKFKGRTSQIPPMFSALKHKGVPLYKLARRGEDVSRKPRDIEIYSLLIDEVSLPEIGFTVKCSRGTYVRTLAHDIGGKLGCGAHLVKLRRTASGPFTLNEAQPLDALAELIQNGGEDNIIIPSYEALGHLTDFQVDESVRERVSHGIAPEVNDLIPLDGIIEQGTRVRISFAGRLIAVAQVVENDRHILKLLRVFN